MIRPDDDREQDRASWEFRVASAAANGGASPCESCHGTGTRLRLMDRGYGYSHAWCRDCGGTGNEQSRVEVIVDVSPRAVQITEVSYA